MTRGPDLGMLSEVYGTVKRFFEWILVAVILAITLTAIFGLPARLARGQDVVPPDKKLEPIKKLEQPARKPGSADLPTSMKRATERAELEAKARATVLVQVTVTPTVPRVLVGYLVVCNFKDHTIGLWQGGSESETDQWVTIEGDQVSPLLAEAVERSRGYGK